MKSVTGNHWFTGETLTFTACVVENKKADGNHGRWAVVVNGKAVKWYGMESSAIGCVNRLRFNGYGYSFGGPF